VVKAVSDDGTAKSTMTDSNGQFDLNLAQGAWTLVALHDKSLPSEPQQEQLDGDKTDFRFDLEFLSGTPDDATGQRFFRGLCAGLAALIVCYIVLHLAIAPAPRPVSLALTTVIAQAREGIAKAQQVAQAATATGTVARADSARPQAAQDAKLIAAIGQLTTTLAAVFPADSETLSTADRELMAKLASEVSGLVQQGKHDEALTRLETVRRMTDSLGTKGIFWEDEPWRFLEVFMWGLAGILINLIITTGTYLRQRNFYREGVIMHISLIIAVPFLALIFVLLLSLVTVKLTLVGSEVQLDLSDPRVLVAVSFLIGTVPWNIWRFVRGTGERLTGQGQQEAGKSGKS